MRVRRSADAAIWVPELSAVVIGDTQNLHIVEGELSDERRLLKEQREGLADTTSGADHSSLDHF